jgi:hypothetical protein
MTSTPLFILTLLCGGAVAAQGAAQPTASSCIQCHGSFDWIQDSNSVQIVQGFTNDIHYSFGLSCQDCHGGNPDPKLGQDPFGAMDKDYKPNPYRGAPARGQIPDFCGRCHANADYMKRFKPEERVDQLSEYWTSRHGILLKAGDTNVATCVDCHGVHSIRAPSDGQSSVYPTAVAETCKRCHADPKRMAGYKLPNGQPLPINQYALWRQSVHAKALLEKGDLSAPTCNDCHGNHGAVPPRVTSIVFVCGQCHAREAELFRGSPKQKGFAAHNQKYFSQMGKAGCATCHKAPDPASSVTGVGELSECVTCHGNHAILPPNVTMLGPLPETPCSFCHEPVEKVGHQYAEVPATAAHFAAVRSQLLAKADQLGLKGTARFDWLVGQALSLPPHQLAPSSDGQPATLLPEFARLFTRFRIGRSQFTYSDPATGKPVRQSLIRCTNCHKPGSTGFAASTAMSSAMHNISALSARAERILLAAKRGGVEVRNIQAELDSAVDDQIQLQALVHGFSVTNTSPFMKKYSDAQKVVDKALVQGHAALEQLSFRYKGLFIFLAIILCLLVGLGFKIRQLSRREPAG